MKILWIIVGILVLMWLGFLTISRNAIELRLDRTESKFDGLDNRYEIRQDVDNKGIIDKTEDRIDLKEDELDKNMQMPYEKKENNVKQQDVPTIKHYRDLDEKEQKKVKEKSNGEANASESIVAFAYNLDPIKDTLYNQPTVEAFELKSTDSVFAFKLR